MEPVDDQENTQPTTENDNSDPKEYINRYLNSPDVKEKVEKRYQVARLIDPEVTKEDAYEAFLGTDEAKEALWVFYKNNRFIFIPRYFYSKLQAISTKKRAFLRRQCLPV